MQSTTPGNARNTKTGKHGSSAQNCPFSSHVCARKSQHQSVQTLGPKILLEIYILSPEKCPLSSHTRFQVRNPWGAFLSPAAETNAFLDVKARDSWNPTPRHKGLPNTLCVCHRNAPSTSASRPRPEKSDPRPEEVRRKASPHWCVRVQHTRVLLSPEDKDGGP